MIGQIFREDNFQTFKAILENPEYQPQIDVWHPELTEKPMVQIGAYVGQLSANSTLTDEHMNDVLDYPNAFVLEFQRVLDPETQKLDYSELVTLPLTQRDVADVKDYSTFQNTFTGRILRDVAPYLQKPKLLSRSYFQQLAAEIAEKKVQLEKEYPNCKIAQPLAQDIFDTWENPLHPLLVLPPGFQDDTMHQLRERMAGDEGDAFYEMFPRAVHPNFEGTGRLLYLFEQQYPTKSRLSMRCFVDPLIPSIQYLASTELRLDDILKGASSVVMEEQERIQRFRKLRNGKIPEATERTEAGKVFLSTLYRELQLPCTADDVQDIEFAVIHATEEAFRHNGLQKDIEEFIDRYAPIPAGVEREYYAPKIIEKALENPEVQRITNPTPDIKEK